VGKERQASNNWFTSISSTKMIMMVVKGKELKKHQQMNTENRHRNQSKEPKSILTSSWMWWFKIRMKGKKSHTNPIHIFPIKRKNSN